MWLSWHMHCQLLQWTSVTHRSAAHRICLTGCTPVLQHVAVRQFAAPFVLRGREYFPKPPHLCCRRRLLTVVYLGTTCGRTPSSTVTP